MGRGQDTASGAASGAAIGTAILPGWGTAIGAGVGGLYGYFSGGSGGFDRSKVAEGRYGGVSQDLGVPRFGSQYGNYGQLASRYANQGSSFRGGQQQLGNILAAEAQGNGVGQQLVGMQARTAADRASAQQFGAVAGARPGMQAMASRNAMLGSAMAQSAVGEQAALGSAQMTLGAQQAYGQHLQASRGQDIQQQHVNSQAELEAYRQRLQLSQMQQTGAMTEEQLRAQRYSALIAQNQPTGAERLMGGMTGLAAAYGQYQGNQNGNK